MDRNNVAPGDGDRRTIRTGPALQRRVAIGPAAWLLSGVAALGGVSVVEAVRTGDATVDLLLAVPSLGLLAATAAAPRQCALRAIPPGFGSSIVARALVLFLGPLAGAVTSLGLVLALGALTIPRRARHRAGAAVTISAALGACAEATLDVRVQPQALHIAILLFAVLGAAFLVMSVFETLAGRVGSLTPAVSVALGSSLGRGIERAPSGGDGLPPAVIATCVLAGLCVYVALARRDHAAA